MKPSYTTNYNSLEAIFNQISAWSQTSTIINMLVVFKWLYKKVDSDQLVDTQ